MIAKDSNSGTSCGPWVPCCTVASMDERILLRARIDDLLDKLIAVMAERDLAQEKLAYCENEWTSCMETRGLAL